MFRVLPPASPPPFVLLVNHAMFVALFVNLLFEPWRCQRWPRGVFPVEVCRVTSSCRAILSSYCSRSHCRVTVDLRSSYGRVVVEFFVELSGRGPGHKSVSGESRVPERCVIESFILPSLVVRFGCFAVPAVCARSSAPFVDGFYHSWSSRGSAHTYGDILCIL